MQLREARKEKRKGKEINPEKTHKVRRGQKKGRKKRATEEQVMEDRKMIGYIKEQDGRVTIQKNYLKRRNMTVMIGIILHGKIRCSNRNKQTREQKR